MQIFVVAVGSYIEGVDELVNVASSPPEQFLFRVKSLEGFLQIVQEIRRQLESLGPSFLNRLKIAITSFCLFSRFYGLFSRLILDNIKGALFAQTFTSILVCSHIFSQPVACAKIHPFES